jgi:acyl-coenzyme A synthetase/AMP-(fatty) acid ligase
VVPRDSGAAPADVEAGVRRLVEANLPRHQWPRGIIVVRNLPRTDTGKLQRFRLRDLVRQNRVHQRGDND